MGHGITAGKFLLVALVCLLLVGTAGATDHYVAPNGTATGDGSIGNPWDLQTALNQPASVQPGDTIWVRGGTYQTTANGGFSSQLNGTAASPIIVRNYNGERATLDGQLNSMALYVGGSYTWFWGLEIMSSCTVRVTGQTYAWCAEGVGAYGTNDKFINLIVHDTSQGFSAFNASPDNEFYGNLSYYNGFLGSDRTHGHGMYMQNVTGTKTLSENMVFDNADEGLQIYGSGSASVMNFVMTGNVLFDNGSWPTPNYQYNIIIAGGQTRKNISFQNNFSYFPANANAEGWGGSFGQYTLGQDMTVTNNVFANGYIPVVFTDESGPVVFTGNTVVGATDALRPITLDLWSGQPLLTYTWDNNTYYDQSPDHFFEGTASDGYDFSGVNRSFAGWQSQTGYDAHSTYSQNAPTGVWTYVRPNKYEAKRANVMIFDWDQTATVFVDLSSVLSPGDSYVIRDAQNFYGPAVETGVYSGSPVAIAMMGLSKATPVGFSAPLHTAPQFGTFIVTSSSATASPDTTLPNVSISSPAAGAAVSGTVTVSATASDNVAVASVQFAVDGSGLGSPVMTAPYSTTWDTTTSAAGSHTLTATAKDTSGNTATASITVVVNNAAVSVSVSPSNTALGQGQSKTFTASVANTTNQSVTWSISPSVGSISSGGVYSAPGTVASAQTVIVTATSAANSAKLGTATINLTSNAGTSASGGAVATFVKIDTTTQGNWRVSYGADGYSFTPQSQSLPSYATFSVSNQQNWTWNSSTTDPRALQNATNSGGVAATWYNNTSTFTLDVNSTDGNSHQVALYAVDWDSRSRVETIQVIDANSNALLDSRSISNFVNGDYLVWNVTGHVKFNVTKTNGDNAVISGVFWGGSSSLPATNSAVFTGTDTSTQGNWKGIYGLDGYWIPDTNTNQVPSYVVLTPQNQANWTWTSSGTEVRDLQVAWSSPINIRQASCWYTYPTATYDIDLNFTDGLTHPFEMYALDYDYRGRSEIFQVVDAVTGAVLDTRNVANFTQGIYYKWTLSGHVKINVTVTGGPNAVVGGIFFQ